MQVHVGLISRVLNFVQLVKGQECLCLPTVSWLKACVFKFCGVDECLCAPEGLTFRIPGLYCVTLNTCSRSPVVKRDFKIWYGEAVVRQKIVKITSGDVMSRVPQRLARRSLAFYYGKVPSFMYSSLREYKPAVYFSF